jgi:hypothetical protein
MKNEKGIAEQISFSAVLEKVRDIDGAYICIPDKVLAKLGNKKRFKVKATIDGVFYRSSIMNMGMGMMLGVTKEIRNRIGKRPGDKVSVMLEEDTEDRTVEIPDELNALFKRHPEAAVFFQTLSYSNRKEYVVWITTAKRAETKAERLEKTIAKLLEKKKNPTE